ncbi:hypothetical protein QMZ92_33535 [Streptomyces sp. HNM0645]|uniref:hypothetical protein n=1 Tax=Streptomyces sp. HNM0645 TaxID=2782343 RepID=UPI0024B69FCA|nr:hypothetical protein [Streptomyces sp. HNM0645]MDI9889133.1 hypothetical protein [Streptomyces sp. HNM0645]
MRSVPIALRVAGVAAGFLILAPVPGTAHAEEGARLTDTVHPVRAEPGSEVQDGRESGVVDRLQIVTLTPPSRFQPDDKQGEEEDGKRDEGSRDGKKDDGSRDGKKDDGSRDGKKDDGSRDGRKDDGSRGHGDGSDEDSDDGSHEGDGPEDLVEGPDPAESPVAPVRAGGGGAADRLAAQSAESADTQGPGTPHTVIGLLLAGAAAVAVAFRSARRRRVGPTDRD